MGTNVVEIPGCLAWRGSRSTAAIAVQFRPSLPCFILGVVNSSAEYILRVREGGSFNAPGVEKLLKLLLTLNQTSLLSINLLLEL